MKNLINKTNLPCRASSGDRARVRRGLPLSLAMAFDGAPPPPPNTGGGMVDPTVGTLPMGGPTGGYQTIALRGQTELLRAAVLDAGGTASSRSSTSETARRGLASGETSASSSPPRSFPPSASASLEASRAAACTSRSAGSTASVSCARSRAGTAPLELGRAAAGGLLGNPLHLHAIHRSGVRTTTTFELGIDGQSVVIHQTSDPGVRRFIPGSRTSARPRAGRSPRDGGPAARPPWSSGPSRSYPRTHGHDSSARQLAPGPRHRRRDDRRDGDRLRPRAPTRLPGLRRVPQSFPSPGRVEHRAEDILSAVDDTVGRALEGLADAGGGRDHEPARDALRPLRSDGESARSGIVCDRRTAARCAELREADHSAEVAARTGLVIDPYSATKAEWLIANDEGVRAAADAEDLRFLTVDGLIVHHTRRALGHRPHQRESHDALRHRRAQLRPVAPRALRRGGGVPPGRPFGRRVQ